MWPSFLNPDHSCLVNFINLFDNTLREMLLSWFGLVADEIVPVALYWKHLMIRTTHFYLFLVWYIAGEKIELDWRVNRKKSVFQSTKTQRGQFKQFGTSRVQL